MNSRVCTSKVGLPFESCEFSSPFTTAMALARLPPSICLTLVPTPELSLCHRWGQTDRQKDTRTPFTTFCYAGRWPTWKVIAPTPEGRKGGKASCIMSATPLLLLPRSTLAFLQCSRANGGIASLRYFYISPPALRLSLN